MNHTWKILNEKILSNHLGQEKVIAIIWFRVETVEGERVEVTDGRVNLQTDELTSFIPYAEVELALKISWIKAHAGDFYENLNAEKMGLV